MKNNISLKIVSDGVNHVLDKINPLFIPNVHHIPVSIDDPKMLGFEAHRILSEHLSYDYDYYCYLEDDLVFSDPLFFEKISHFDSLMGSEFLLLPNRYEQPRYPHPVDILYIDGPIDDTQLSFMRQDTNHTVLIPWYPKPVPICKPSNPHSGCFLTKSQLTSWSNSKYWLDFDTSFISPLESAATLGVARTFKCYKPCSEFLLVAVTTFWRFFS